MTVWNNLGGTTAPNFTIGKNGATLHQGTTAPSNATGKDGDIYVRTGASPGLFQKRSGAWVSVSEDTFSRQAIINGATGTINDLATYVGVTGPWSAGASILTLPSGFAGKQLTVKDESGQAEAHPITITGATIDGQPSYVISVNYGSVTLSHSGTAWFVVRKS